MSDDAQDWMRDLARAADSARAEPGTGALLAEVRRRRARRRGALAAAAAVVAVGAVAVVPALAGGPVDGSGGPAAQEPTRGPETAAAFDCPRGLQTLRAQVVPPVPDLAGQREAIERMERRSAPISSWRLMHAEPSHLGPVALVDGDWGGARELLEQHAGRDVLVGPWAEEDPASGMTLANQVDTVVQWQLQPVVADVRRATRGVRGDAGIALWDAAGAVVLQWKRPVPEAVAELAGVRESGVTVVVQPVRYSSAEVSRAGSAVFDHLEAADRDVTETYGCADNSGLVVGLPPPVRTPARTARELAEVAGMPVTVVRSGPFEDLGPLAPDGG